MPGASPAANQHHHQWGAGAYSCSPTTNITHTFQQIALNPLPRPIHKALSFAVTRNKGITNDASEAASFLGLLTHVMKPKEGSGIYSGLTPLRITADTHKMVGGTAIHNLTDPYSRHPMHVVRSL